MPSHRKTKRKKKGAKKDRSSITRTPGDAPGTTMTRKTTTKPPQKQGKKTNLPVARMRKPRLHKMDHQNFYAFNELTGPDFYFYPDLVSPHNSLDTKFLNGNLSGLREYESAVEGLTNSIGLDETTIPPRRLKKVPGGYLINAVYADTIESYHEIWMGIRDPYLSRRPPRKTARIIMAHSMAEFNKYLTQRTKRKQDGIHRDRIERRLRFCESQKILGRELPKINITGQQRLAQRAKTRDELELKLKNRNYNDILRIAVLMTLRYHNEKEKRVYVVLQNKRKGIKLPTRRKSRGIQPQQQLNRVATGMSIKLLRHWHNPHWGTCTNRRYTSKTRETLLNWEAKQKYRDRKRPKRNIHAATKLGKMTRWEIVKRSRTKNQRSSTSINQGTDRLREKAPWLAPPWMTRGRGNLTEMAPWMVPPWENRRFPYDFSRYRETQRRTTTIYLREQPWLVPPWGGGL